MLATFSLTYNGRNVSVHSLSKNHSLPLQVRRFAMKGLPRVQIKHAEQA
jgi:hypothetical protein